MSIPAKLKTKVLNALPKSAPSKSRILWQPTGIGKTHVLRVVTTAWRTLPRSERIYKLQRAIQPRLTPAELDEIFRISVLTQDEFMELRKNLPRLRHRANGVRSKARTSANGLPASAKKLG